MGRRKRNRGKAVRNSSSDVTLTEGKILQQKTGNCVYNDCTCGRPYWSDTETEDEAESDRPRKKKKSKHQLGAWYSRIVRLLGGRKDPMPWEFDEDLSEMEDNGDQESGPNYDSDQSYEGPDSQDYYHLKWLREMRKLRKKESKRIIGIEEEIRDIYEAWRKATKDGRKVPIGSLAGRTFKLYSRNLVNHFDFAETYHEWPHDTHIAFHDDDTENWYSGHAGMEIGSGLISGILWIDEELNCELKPFRPATRTSKKPMTIQNSDGKYDFSITFFGQAYLRLRIPRDFIFSSTELREVSLPPFAQSPPEVFEFFGKVEEQDKHATTPSSTKPGNREADEAKGHVAGKERWAMYLPKTMSEYKDFVHRKEDEVRAAYASLRIAKREGKQVPFHDLTDQKYRLYSSDFVNHPAFDTVQSIELVVTFKRFGSDLLGMIYFRNAAIHDFGPFSHPSRASRKKLRLRIHEHKYLLTLRFLGNGHLKLGITRALIFQELSTPPADAMQRFKFYGIWIDREQEKTDRREFSKVLRTNPKPSWLPPGESMSYPGRMGEDDVMWPKPDDSDSDLEFDDYPYGRWG